MSSQRYAYLKPCRGDSPFYVHVTLDGKAQRLRLYWHMGWWKNETVDPALFAHWQRTFRDMARRLERSKPKERKHSYRVQGHGRLSSTILRDIVGFVETDTQPSLPAKLDCYVNAENKLIEVEALVAYRSLGRLPSELLRLKDVFTDNPDCETVRAKLVFFDPVHLLPYESTDGSVPAGREGLAAQDLPRHHGSPDAARRLAPTAAAAAVAATPDLRLAEDEFVVDPTLNSRNGHPYGLPLAPPSRPPTPPPPPATDENEQ